MDVGSNVKGAQMKKKSPCLSCPYWSECCKSEYAGPCDAARNFLDERDKGADKSHE